MSHREHSPRAAVGVAFDETHRLPDDCGECGSLRAAAVAARGSLWPEGLPSDAAWEEIEARIEADRAGSKIRVVLGCAFCHDSLPRAEAVYCATCLAPHHGDCFAQHGRCSAPGCGDTQVVRARDGVAPPAGPQRPRRRWAWTLLAALGAVSLATSAISALAPWLDGSNTTSQGPTDVGPPSAEHRPLVSVSPAVPTSSIESQVAPATLDVSYLNPRDVDALLPTLEQIARVGEETASVRYLPEKRVVVVRASKSSILAISRVLDIVDAGERIRGRSLVVLDYKARVIQIQATSWAEGEALKERLEQSGAVVVSHDASGNWILYGFPVELERAERELEEWARTRPLAGSVWVRELGQGRLSVRASGAPAGSLLAEVVLGGAEGREELALLGDLPLVSLELDDVDWLTALDTIARQIEATVSRPAEGQIVVRRRARVTLSSRDTPLASVLTNIAAPLRESVWAANRVDLIPSIDVRDVHWLEAVLTAASDVEQRVLVEEAGLRVLPREGSPSPSRWHVLRTASQIEAGEQQVLLARLEQVAKLGDPHAGRAVRLPASNPIYLVRAEGAALLLARELLARLEPETSADQVGRLLIRPLSEAESRRLAFQLGGVVLPGELFVVGTPERIAKARERLVRLGFALDASDDRR